MDKLLDTNCKNCVNYNVSNRKYPCSSCNNFSKFRNKFISCYNCKYKDKSYYSVYCDKCDLKHNKFEFKEK